MKLNSIYNLLYINYVENNYLVDPFNPLMQTCQLSRCLWETLSFDLFCWSHIMKVFSCRPKYLFSSFILIIFEKLFPKCPQFTDQRQQNSHLLSSHALKPVFHQAEFCAWSGIFPCLFYKLVPHKKSQDKEKVLSMHEIPPSGKPALVHNCTLHEHI